MKYINLLPKEDQKEIRLEKINSGLVNLFIWLFVSMGVFALLFLIAQFYLSSASSNYDRLIEQQKQVVALQENKEVKAEVIQFNTLSY